MTIIKQADFIQSVQDALQYISYYHPEDYIQALGEAYKIEQSPAAKDAIAQILTNSRLCAEGKRPICQDTGIVVAFVKVGMSVRFEGDLSLDKMVDEGVRRAYLLPENTLRASIVNDPAGLRKNTKDNTPAITHVELVHGDTVEVSIAAKGGGSENKAKLAMLNPNDSIVDWILETVPTMGAGWCPPGMLGIGIGGTAEKAMVMAKESLMQPINMHELKQKATQAKEKLNRIEELRLEIYEKVNNLGIGAQGLGGLTTVLDVKILDYPTHAASLPVAIIPNCAATRHIHFVLDGTGTAELTPPDITSYPDVHWAPSVASRKVNVNSLTKADIANWQAGETLLLTGKILTGRDAAHKRIKTMLAKGEELPVDLSNRFIYYVGPVDAVRDEAVGPAGPTTATRMDDYTEMMLGELNLLGSIGKAERGDEALAVIKKYKSVYLMAVGGAAYLVSKAIKKSRVIAFEDLGMEAIYEFDVVDMPVTVAVSATGESVHKTGPEIWRKKIAQHQTIEIKPVP
jgi:fumarate hydratase, class I